MFAALTITQLKRSFITPGGARVTIIDVPAFEIAAGGQAALFGPSGCGKTTFLNLIAGILAADAGRIEIAGEAISGLSEVQRDRLRGRRIGYIFQTFNLLQGYTALENIELAMQLGGGLDSAWARSLLERVGLGDRLHHRPRQLSVGQQQRVAVARALVNRPALVLADEPTGNLDPEHAQRALGLIRELCGEMKAALLLVSHERDILSRFDSRGDFTTINQARPSSATAGAAS